MLETVIALETIRAFQKLNKRPPNVTELSKMLGMTRNTVYRRLRVLEQDGKIERAKVVVSAGYKLK